MVRQTLAMRFFNCLCLLRYYTTSFHWSLSILPENIRKSKVSKEIVAWNGLSKLKRIIIINFYYLWNLQTIPYSNLDSQVRSVSFVSWVKTRFPLKLKLAPVMILYKCLWLLSTCLRDWIKLYWPETNFYDRKKKVTPIFNFTCQGDPVLKVSTSYHVCKVCNREVLSFTWNFWLANFEIFFSL